MLKKILYEDNKIRYAKSHSFKILIFGIIISFMKNISSSFSNIDSTSFRKSILFIFLLSMLVFGKSIFNEYAMDDEYVVKDNPQVHKGIKAIPEIFRTTYVVDNKRYSYEYRPLVKVTYAIEYQFFKENPHVSHLVNILLYALAVTILFIVLLKLFSHYHYFFSLSICLIFLVHPLHSEVVMSLKNRDVIMSFIGSLLSLNFYLKYSEDKKLLNVFWGLFFMLFALLSKKDSITFYAVIPFTIWFFRRISLKQIILLLVLNVLPFLLYVLASKSIENKETRTLLQWENPFFVQSTTFFERIPQGLYSIYFYIKMFVFPHPLIVYYGYNQVPIVDWSHPVVIITLLGLFLFLYYFFKNIRNKNTLVFGFVFFLITISMFTNIVKPVVGIVAERFAFIPSVGLCIGLVWLVFTYFKVPLENLSLKWKQVGNSVLLFLVVFVVLYGGKTFSRNAAWKDSYTIYKTDVETAKESAHTHSLFAASSISQIRSNPKMKNADKKLHVDNAIKHYKESLRILPDYVTSLNNIGMVYYTYYNKPIDAIPYLEKAVKLDSTYTEAYFNLATCYAAIKEYALAEKYYLKVIAMYDHAFVMQKKLEIAMEQIKLMQKDRMRDQGDMKRAYKNLNKLSKEYMTYDGKSIEFINSYYSLSNMYAFNKQYEKIIELNVNAIKKDLKSDIPYINIGNVYFMQGDTLKALPYLEKAIQQNWNNRFLNSFLSDYYYRKGDQEKAVFYLKLKQKSQK